MNDYLKVVKASEFIDEFTEPHEGDFLTFKVTNNGDLIIMAQSKSHRDKTLPIASYAKGEWSSVCTLKDIKGGEDA